jgi:hypothetical protein
MFPKRPEIPRYAVMVETQACETIDLELAWLIARADLITLKNAV